jgi:hypothetical protein
MTAAPRSRPSWLPSRETVLDSKIVVSKNAATIALEVLQRGVLVNEKDPSKILDAVRSTAGKP